MAKLVSQTYAQALFELAVEKNETSMFMDETLGLEGMIYGCFFLISLV